MYGYSSPRTYPSQTVVTLPDFEKEGPGPQFGEVSVVAVFKRASLEGEAASSQSRIRLHVCRYDGLARRRNLWADQYYGARPADVARFALSYPSVV